MTQFKYALILAAIGGGLASAAPAEAATRCSAVAVRADGARLVNTRSDEVGVAEADACRSALRTCEDRLDWLRRRVDRALPEVGCEVTGVEEVADARLDPPKPRTPDADAPVSEPRRRGLAEQAPSRADRSRPRADDGRIGPPGGALRCAYQACAAAYRSFRASDCSFQPYSGPRKRCEK